MEDFLFLFFEPSETSQAAGRAFWARRHQRTADVDRETTQQTMKAQFAATSDWKQPRGEADVVADLKGITQPTLVVNGRHDIIDPTINSYLLAQHLPAAELIIYPDSGHGSHVPVPRAVRGPRRAVPRRRGRLHLKAARPGPAGCCAASRGGAGGGR